MSKRKQDNYRETVRTVASRILGSDLVPFVGFADDQHRLAGLQRAARHDNDNISWTYSSVTFRRASTDCTLDIEIKSVASTKSYRDALFVDEEGNEWGQYVLSCRVNFPSHGSCSPDVVMARLALYQEVTQLAADIQAEFQDREIWRMTATAEELVKIQAGLDDAKVARLVREVVVDSRRYMRVGASSLVALDPSRGKIPAGFHDVNIGEPNGTRRGYTLIVGVNGAISATLRRTA